MLKQWRGALLAVALLCLAATSGLAAGTIRWQTSFDAAKALSRKSNKLILVDFYADW